MLRQSDKYFISRSLAYFRLCDTLPLPTTISYFLWASYTFPSLAFQSWKTYYSSRPKGCFSPVVRKIIWITAYPHKTKIMCKPWYLPTEKSQQRARKTKLFRANKWHIIVVHLNSTVFVCFARPWPTLDRKILDFFTTSGGNYRYWRYRFCHDIVWCHERALCSSV